MTVEDLKELEGEKRRSLLRNDDFQEDIWNFRERVIYRKLFKDLGADVFTLDYDLFSEALPVIPFWLCLGVFESPPQENRPYWCYVSSGMSQPWNLETEEDLEDDDYSFFGFEFVLFTLKKAEWAVKLLKYMMAHQILVGYDRIPGQIYDFGQVVHLGLDPTEGKEDQYTLNNLLISEPRTIDPTFKLKSGRVEWFQIVGVTDSEKAYLKEHGAEDLVVKLYEKNVAPITVPVRKSVV